MAKPYSAHECGDDKKCYVAGPGDGFGFYAGTLWPNMRLSSKGDAEAAALIANEAYRIGYLQAKADIRAALGVK